MSRFAGAVGVISVLLLVLVFARLNGGEHVTIDLGITVFYRVPLTYVAFAGLFVGMLVMFVAGIHSDLRVRRFLRHRLEEEGREEQKRIDRDQRDLFQPEPDA